MQTEQLLEGEYFHLKIEIPENFPFEPPVVLMKTKVYHPNINYKTGSIWINILKKNNRTATNTIQQVLLYIQGYLNEPNTKYPLMSEINNVYLNDIDKYNEIVRK